MYSIQRSGPNERDGSVSKMKANFRIFVLSTGTHNTVMDTTRRGLL
jgi:hypothetical protein